jgi:hypothetical protein
MEKAELTLLIAVIALITSASLVGQMTYTGNILTGGSCGPLGCLQVCDTADDCVSGLACCPSSWGTGLCDKASSCESIAVFTRTHAEVSAGVPVRYNAPDQDSGALAILISMIAISAVFILLWFIYRLPTQRMARQGGEE